MSAIPPRVKVPVPSLTDETKSPWMVERWPFENHALCDCPAFQRSLKTPKSCKHVELAERAFQIIGKCKMRHGHDQNVACYACVVAFMAAAKRKVDRDYERRGAPHDEHLQAMVKFLQTKKVKQSKDPLRLLLQWAERKSSGKKVTTRNARVAPQSDGRHRLD